MTNIDRVRDVFRGLANRDPALAVRHLDPERYVEHDPQVADGVTGVRAYVEAMALVARMEIVRIFEDGDLVVAQADGQVRGDGTFFDVFRFDGGVIVEHWGFAAPSGLPNLSGHTQVDGPVEAGRPEDTAANKAFVRDYYETFHLQARHDLADRYFAGSPMIRHEPGVSDGVDAFLRDLAVATRDRTIDEIQLLAGRGDLVFLAALGTHRDEPCAYVDLYRVERYTIAEHWGFFQPDPAVADRRKGSPML